MGGIISLHLSIRDYNRDILMKYQHMLPEYFTAILTTSDLIRCRQHWQTITMDTVYGFQANKSVKVSYDSCKTWLHCLLYHESASNMPLSLRLPTLQHNFLNFMKAMVVIALKQEKDNHQSHDNEIKFLCTKIQNLGFGYEHFLSFFPAFLSSLRVISGREWTFYLERSWQHLLSSIIFICLPNFPVKEIDHLPTSDGEEHSMMSMAISHRLVVGIPNEKSTNHERMYTSYYNSVL